MSLPPATFVASTDGFALELVALRPKLRLMARRYVKDRSRADDLVHDTLLRALRYRERFAQGGHLRAWLGAIMANIFINGYRRLRRESQILEGVTRYDVARMLSSDAARNRALGPEKQLLWAGLSDPVLHAVRALPKEFADVVVLCDLMDHSYRTAAAIVGCPLGTIMSRLHRGRKLLQVQLINEAQMQGIHKAA